MITVQYGLSSDVPAPGDYDGDGKADIGVWRNSDTHFYSVNSSNGGNQWAILGNSGDTPVCADYDGDGKMNYAVKHSNSWIIENAALTGTTTTVWQSATDIPVPNDYDGDEKADIAVWRGSGLGIGYWFIRQSGSNGSLRQVLWGTTGDIPVPAFYRR